MTRIERLLGRKTSDANRYPGLLAGVVVMVALISGAVGAQILFPSAAARRQDVVDAQPEQPPSGEAGQAGAESAARPHQAARVETTQTAVEAVQVETTQTAVATVQVETTQTAVEVILDERQDPPVDVAGTLKVLYSSDPAARAAAACRLGKLGAAESIPALVNLLGDDTPIEPMKCWESGNWTPARTKFKHSSPGEQSAIALAAQGQAVVAPLVAALGSADSIVRRNAAWALGEVRGGRATDRAEAVDPLIAALRDADPWVRTAAAYALGEMQSRRSVEALIASLGDAESGVRVMAAWALGEMKTRAGVESLTALLHDDVESVRRMAAWALDEIGVREKTS